MQVDSQNPSTLAGPRPRSLPEYFAGASASYSGMQVDSQNPSTSAGSRSRSLPVGASESFAKAIKSLNDANKSLADTTKLLAELNQGAK
jgi:hypothetical protein